VDTDSGQVVGYGQRVRGGFPRRLGLSIFGDDFGEPGFGFPFGGFRSSLLDHFDRMHAMMNSMVERHFQEAIMNQRLGPSLAQAFLAGDEELRQQLVAGGLLQVHHITPCGTAAVVLPLLLYMHRAVFALR
jgi:hypothetical protein